MNAHSLWSANNGEYILEITPEAWQILEIECEKVRNTETGGILIGYYTSDHSIAVLTEVTPPPNDSIFGLSWLVRGVRGLRSLLAQRWKNPFRRTYYIGEWHYHPTDLINPSDEDILQMQEISRSRNYQCNEPIMLIVGYKSDKSRPVRLFVFPNNKPRYEYHL